MVQSQDSKASFVICGDCHAKHSEWLNSNSTDQHGRSALEFCVYSDFIQLIEEPTHISIATSKVCEYIGTSEHRAVEMNISVICNIPNATTGKTVWLKSAANRDRINEASQTLNISDTISYQVPKKLNEMLMVILVRYIPREDTKFRTNDQPRLDDTRRRV